MYSKGSKEMMTHYNYKDEGFDIYNPNKIKLIRLNDFGNLDSGVLSKKKNIAVNKIQHLSRERKPDDMNRILDKILEILSG